MASSSTPTFSQQPQGQPQGRGQGRGRGQWRGRGGGGGRGRGRGQPQQSSSQYPQREQSKETYTAADTRVPRAIAWPSCPRILVVDLEATCWDSRTPPPGQKNEIIEIGWALVDLGLAGSGTDNTSINASNSDNNSNNTNNNGTNASANGPSIIRNGTILVKPVKSEVSAFCTELTTITAELLNEEGVSLRQAFKQLTEEVQSLTIPWCSWGDYDRNMINRTCSTMQIASPFHSTHYNVKNLCKEMYPYLNGGYGMANALQRVAKEPLEGTHHRGGDDAYNIAKILNFLITEKKRREALKTGL